MKIQATGNNDPFNRLPDEIVFNIINKIIDLKTLCICNIVCKCFCSITVQVDTISYTTPPFVFDSDDGVPTSDAIEACFDTHSFQSAIKSLNKFKCIKSLFINLSFPIQQDTRHTIKWKGKFGNNKVDSFLLISPDSIYRCNDSNINVQNDDCGELGYRAVMRNKLDIAHKCLGDAIVRFRIILFRYVTGFPLLEKVSITDSAKMGTVSMNGARIAEMRKLLLSQSTQHLTNHGMKNLNRVSWCYIPLLELPVSKYVMKGVNFVLFEMDKRPNLRDSILDVVEDMDAFEENEEAAYNEALMEIFKKHRGLIKTL